MFLIPTSHENLEGRRWPWITIGIVVLNVLAFAATNSAIEREAGEVGLVKVRIVLLAAMHSDVETPPEAQKLVEQFRRASSKEFEQLRSSNRRVEPLAGVEWDITMREYDRAQANEEMARLNAQLVQMQASSVIEQYAFHPGEREAKTYLTANFLHGGYFHIIFNMWFLWLAGSVLEDAWGRLVYPVFYVLAGAVAMQAQAWATPDSLGGVIGASGAVAALMGAFLVRFFRTKIQFALLWFFGFVPRLYKFKAPAYLMLPLWLLIQLFWAQFEGANAGIAYWTHIGGFAFGFVVAMGMKFSGLEARVDQAIEKQVGWSADPRVVRAGEILQNDPNGAIAELEPLLKENPNQIDALAILERAYWQKKDFENYRATLAELCRLHLKNKDGQSAWQNYEDFVNAGGEKLPAGEWMQLCRWLEGQQSWDRAAGEYEKYARAYASDRMSVYALVAAARIHLKNLNNRIDAARLYREAEASPVPHLDWDDAIRRGLREATAPAEPAPAASH